MADQQALDRAAIPEEFSVRRFATDMLAERDRPLMGREEVGRTIVHVEIQPLTSETFRVEASVGPILHHVAGSALLQRSADLSLEEDACPVLTANLGW